MLLRNVRPLINGKLNILSDILLANGKISAIAKANTTLHDSDYLDAGGAVCASGYIDIHTHGGGGHDMMEGTYTAIDTISRYHLSTGTTSYCPTTLTADIPTTLNAMDNVKAYTDISTGRRLGIHLEGPFISLKAPGAHPPEYILNPTPENTKWVWDYKSIVGRVTVAPDNSGSAWFTTECTKNNIQVSLGHDASIDDEINLLIGGGASSVTHMYNCTSRPSRRATPHKHLGLTEMGLITDKLVCEVIGDDRHVPNALFNMIYKLKGASGINLVSDSLSVAGMGEGEFYLGSGDSKQRLLVDDGVATLPDLNTYAGSVTPISAMVYNIHNNADIPLEDAIVMGTLTPAKLMGLHDRGDIKIGYLADLNLLSDDGELINTIFNGKLLNK